MRHTQEPSYSLARACIDGAILSLLCLAFVYLVFGLQL